ncbi:MAG: thiamine phosphate synthase [Myxococcota bacterium]
MDGALPRLWLITDPQHTGGPIEPLRRALAGTERQRVGVQLRAKNASDRQVFDWGRELRVLTRERGASLVVNGRADIAARIEADGVHLGERGLSVAQTRKLVSSSMWIGVSRHDQAGLTSATDAGADYGFLSPVFEVPGKNRPLGIEGFGKVARVIDMPVFGLGGLNARNLGPLRLAGGFGAAVCRAVYRAEDPCQEVDRCLVALDKLPADAG